MDNIKFIDTTLRDGQQSLWGMRMTTGMMLPIMSRIDRIGFEAIEAESGGSWKIRVRQQKEEPWERVRLLAKNITHTPLSIMAGSTTGSFYVSPLAASKLRLERMAANGIKRANLSEPSNDLNFMLPELVECARSMGLMVAIGLIFSVSPKHSDEYYARKAREARGLKPDRIFLKDSGGLLTPERTRTLIPAMQRSISGLTFELHSHCTTGLAPLCYLEAIKLGVSILHTGIPPLANGPAQPSLTNVMRNARLLGYGCGIDEALVKQVSDHFAVVARREDFPIGVPLEYDYAQYLHQVPGGVISNLKRQLGELGLAHRLDEVLKETVEVRRDLGYPIMVTPFSQLVVTQATLNVVLGERYREVPDEVIQYASGYWGEEASSEIDPEVKARILDRPRAKDIARRIGEDLTLRDIREKFGSPGVSDDELLVRFVMGGETELAAIRPAAAVREYQSTRTPLPYLVQQLAKRDDISYVRLEKESFSLILRRTVSPVRLT